MEVDAKLYNNFRKPKKLIQPKQIVELIFKDFADWFYNFEQCFLREPAKEIVPCLLEITATGQ